MAVLLVILAALCAIGLLAIAGAWERGRRHRRTEDLARLTGERTAEEILNRLKA